MLLSVHSVWSPISISLVFASATQLHEDEHSMFKHCRQQLATKLKPAGAVVRGCLAECMGQIMFGKKQQATLPHYPASAPSHEVAASCECLQSQTVGTFWSASSLQRQKRPVLLHREIAVSAGNMACAVYRVDQKQKQTLM